MANVAKCFHTKLITTHPIARMEQDNVVHIEFDEHHAMEDAKRIVTMAIDNFENRDTEVMIPSQKAAQIAGFGVESIEYHLGGTFRGSYYTLNDNIINGRIRGVAGVVGCNNARTRHNEAHIALVKELLEFIGLEPERFQMSWVSAAEGTKYTQIIKEFVNVLEPLGPQTKLRREQ